MAQCGTLALLATLLLSPPLASQTRPDQETDQARAERLEAKANAILMSGDMEQWVDAAELLVESAHLRPESDFSAARNLQFAAEVFAWSGDLEKARVLFEEAAERATSTGESVFAANTYLDCAFVSAQLGMGRHTIAAARAARELAKRHEVSWKDRDQLLARLARLEAPTTLGEIM
jgi:ATP/maltotriose-dependent transcriptional regulator MalT